MSSPANSDLSMLSPSSIHSRDRLPSALSAAHNEIRALSITRRFEARTASRFFRHRCQNTRSPCDQSLRIARLSSQPMLLPLRVCNTSHPTNNDFLDLWLQLLNTSQRRLVILKIEIRRRFPSERIQFTKSQERFHCDIHAADPRRLIPFGKGSCDDLTFFWICRSIPHKYSPCQRYWFHSLFYSSRSYSAYRRRSAPPIRSAAWWPLITVFFWGLAPRHVPVQSIRSPCFCKRAQLRLQARCSSG